MNRRPTYPDLRDARLGGGLLAEVVHRNRARTLPWILDRMVEVGIVRNFERAAGVLPGDYEGLPNADEFLYKAIEAAGYVLRAEHDPALADRVHALAQTIAAAQEPDGYLRTPHTIHWARGGHTPRAARWENLNGDLELYCLGHLFEGAVSIFEATGHSVLLDVARKAADLVESRFGPEKPQQGVDMIPEIELALVRLADTVGDDRYLRLAHYFVEARGNASDHPLMGSFSLDHAPLADQEEAVGHATFAAYLYSAAVDLTLRNVGPDRLPVVKRLWEDAILTKMSVNGGFGARHDIEGFADRYDLPNLTAYNEICAAVGFCGLNQRLFTADPDARYFDVLERTLYNNLLSGVGNEGESFFYVCPTESDGAYAFNMGWLPDGYQGPYSERVATRKPWIPCACCPPTLARWLAQVPRFALAYNEASVWVNLYAAGEFRLPLGDSELVVTVETDYPWSGAVRLQVNVARPLAFALRLRIPSWVDSSPIWGDLYRFLDSPAETPTLRLNGEKIGLNVDRGYATLDRTWTTGDIVLLDLPMPARRIASHPSVADSRGKIALQRGPILFCLEEQDIGGPVRSLELNPAAEIEFQLDGPLGLPCLQFPVQDGTVTRQALAIPYFAWSNRGPNEMTVWCRLPSADRT